MKLPILILLFALPCMGQEKSPWLDIDPGAAIELGKHPLGHPDRPDVILYSQPKGYRPKEYKSTTSTWMNCQMMIDSGWIVDTTDYTKWNRREYYGAADTTFKKPPTFIEQFTLALDSLHRAYEAECWADSTVSEIWVPVDSMWGTPTEYLLRARRIKCPIDWGQGFTDWLRGRMK